MDEIIVVVKKVCQACGEETLFTHDMHNEFIGIVMHDASLLSLRLGYIKVECSRCGNDDATYLNVQVRPRTEHDRAHHTAHR
jgi:ribosomal protein S27AE